MEVDKLVLEQFYDFQNVKVASMPSTKIDLVCSNLILRVRITCLTKHKRNVLLFVTVPMGSYKTFKRCYIPLVQFYVEHSSFLAVPFSENPGIDRLVDLDNVLGQSKPLQKMAHNVALKKSH